MSDIDKLPRKTYKLALHKFKVVEAPLPPNTLRNNDGTPYSANNPINELPKVVRYRLDEAEDEQERELNEQVQGPAPLSVEIEWQGKIYAGMLFFDRNVKK